MLSFFFKFITVRVSTGDGAQTPTTPDIAAQTAPIRGIHGVSDDPCSHQLFSYLRYVYKIVHNVLLTDQITEFTNLRNIEKLFDVHTIVYFNLR